MFYHNADTFSIQTLDFEHAGQNKQIIFLNFVAIEAISSLNLPGLHVKTA